MINLQESPSQQEVIQLDMNYHIRAFKEIQINQHLIDRVKCLGDEKYISRVIDLCEKKLEKGLKLVEFLMQERLWFLSQMQKNEYQLLNIIKLLRDYDYTGFNKYNKFLLKVYSFEEFEQICQSQQNEVISTMSNYFEIFKRINTSLQVDDKTLIYQSEWRENIKQEFAGNKLLKENMSMNLKSSARDIFLYFKRKRTSLRSIVSGGIKHESIVSFLEYLEFFSYELENRVPLELKVLCHLWIEDLLREQTRYEFNITIQNSFIVDYFAKTNTVMFKLQKINYSLEAIQDECQNILSSLDNVILPNQDMTENIFIQSNSFNRINKIQQKVHKLLEEAEYIQNSNYIVQFLTLKNPINDKRSVSQQSFDEENIDKLDTAYQGALILYGDEVNILQSYRNKKIKHFKEKIEGLQIQMDGVKLILQKLNDIWLALRYFRQAQNFFQKTVEDYEKINVNLAEYQQNNESAINDYYQISTEFLYAIFKFQKFHNWLTFLKNSIKQIQPYMRNITDFDNEIEVLLVNAEFFMEEVDAKHIIIANKIVTEYRKKNPVSVTEHQQKTHSHSHLQYKTQFRKLMITGNKQEKNKQKDTPLLHSFYDKEQNGNDPEGQLLNSEEEFDLLLDQQAFQTSQIKLFEDIQLIEQI